MLQLFAYFSWHVYYHNSDKMYINLKNKYLLPYCHPFAWVCASFLWTAKRPKLLAGNMTMSAENKPWGCKGGDMVLLPNLNLLTLSAGNNKSLSTCFWIGPRMIGGWKNLSRLFCHSQDIIVAGFDVSRTIPSFSPSFSLQKKKECSPFETNWKQKL